MKIYANAAQGIRASVRRNPIARSLVAYTNATQAATHDDGTVTLFRVGVRINLDLPNNARAWLNAFDAGENVGPLTFDVNVPPEWRKV